MSVDCCQKPGRARLDASIPQTRFLTLKQSSKFQKTLEKINRESMSEQVCTGTISLECKPKKPPDPPSPPQHKPPKQHFGILIPVLLLLILTGIGGGAYTTSSSDAICAPHDDCNEPKRKSHRPHKRILKHGSRGADVKRLQKLLNARGLCPQPIALDGIFGRTTLDAVKKFQRQFNLPVDGIVGGKTWDRLFASS